MKFCDKLIILRRKKGMSQEQLADYLNVSRQSVSKWEADRTMPEIVKLKGIADLFGVSLDYLLRDEIEQEYVPDRGNEDIREEIGRQISEALVKDSRIQYYEFRSRTEVFGIPLVHINLNREKTYKRKLRKAKGIIAVGDIAVGVISIGCFSTGAVSIGIMSAGVLSAGLLSLGGISLGVVAGGILALGVTAAGIVSAGVASIGLYATGVAALGREAATGISVYANTAIGIQGEKITGLNTMAVESFHSLPREDAANFIYQHCPEIPGWILRLLTSVYK